MALGTVRWNSWLLRRSFDRFSSQLFIIYLCELKFTTDLSRSRADSRSARTPPVGGQRCARCSAVGPPKWCDHLHSQPVGCGGLKKYGVGGVTCNMCETAATRPCLSHCNQKKPSCVASQGGPSGCKKGNHGGGIATSKNHPTQLVPHAWEIGVERDRDECSHG